MKLAISGATTMKADLWQDLDAAQAAGFDAVELWAEKLDRAAAERGIEEVRRAIDERGLQVSAISALERITFRTPAEEEQLKERCRQLADHARRIGCPNLLAVPGPAPAGVKPADLAHETARVLTDLSDIAGRQVNLAFEFGGGAELSVRTLEQAAAAVDFCGRINVGLAIDCFRLFSGGSDASLIARLRPERIFVVQLSDAEDRPREELRDEMRLLPGTGALPLDEMLGALKQIGYDSAISVELLRPEYWERDPAELARECRARALDVLGKAGFVDAAADPGDESDQGDELR